MSKSLFVSWTRDNPRTNELSKALGIKAEFFSGTGPALWRYICFSWATAALLRRERPTTLIIMLPPMPLAIVAHLYCRVSKTRLIADMHTGAFSDPKWAWSLRLTLRMLRGQQAIVTNEHLGKVCEYSGVRPVVLHDFLHRQQSQEILPTRGMAIVCPLSYANDEPVDAILDAAASTPELTWVLTGVAPQEVIGRATPNVSFPGFIPRPSYTRLVAEAAVIVALTNRPHTMQRAGYEALMFERAQVTADFPELRDFLGGASLYSGLSSSEITETVRRAFQSRDELQVEAHRVLSTRIEEQTLVIRELKAQMKYADRPG